ncbi:hypothetical protein HZY91_02645 [Facklamia sp. DSM 111018]|uniref:Uncharacterized protein n=1 Tax=Facklamia lactis TaxID=2749967 RepID=A0ABS0LR76_9LACT|nr:hypothetical protein [Facklamia lactis]MBG9979542.1 hypothetical protein [Facklamia lactis]MBG9985789.1 hypothetical protein [Facklamia lactis]
MPLKMTDLLLIIIVIFSVLGLQVFLSMKKEKYFGLILPILIGIYSVYNVLTSDFYSEMTSRYYRYSSIVQACIPSILLLVVYFICRFVRNKKE